jgi:hypothetical protein
LAQEAISGAQSFRSLWLRELPIICHEFVHYAHAYDPDRVVDEAIHGTSSLPDILHTIAGDLQ